MDFVGLFEFVGKFVGGFADDFAGAKGDDFGGEPDCEEGEQKEEENKMGGRHGVVFSKRKAGREALTALHGGRGNVKGEK